MIVTAGATLAVCLVFAAVYLHHQVRYFQKYGIPFWTDWRCRRKLRKAFKQHRLQHHG